MSTLKTSVLALTACLAGCGVKDSNYLNLQQATQPGSRDTTPPSFYDHSPDTTTLGPFGIATDNVTIDDSSGVNFVVPSGLDPSKVTLTINGELVQVSHVGDKYSGPVGADGPKTVVYHATDFAGNTDSARFIYTVKNDPPGVTFGQTLSPTMQSNAATVSFAMSGTVGGGSIVAATETILQPGSSNTCGNSDNTPLSVGTAPNQAVGTNNLNFLSTVAANGAFAGTMTVTNAVLPGGQPATRMYCLEFKFEDGAKAGNGTPAHHVTKRDIAVVVGWAPPPSGSLTANATFHHVGSGNEVCVLVTGTPGASYAGAINGPGFGPVTFAGSIGPSGAAISRITVPQLGTYSGVVNSGSQSATFSVNVTADPGTCT